MADATCLACERGVPKKGRRRCPECGYVFRGAGWDGVEAHWTSKHADQLPYDRFWRSLCRSHRERVSLGCPCCKKGMPAGGPCQCPECAQVFRGKGWGGLESHWKSRHSDVLGYDDLMACLCPAHRGRGDKSSGYLPLGER